MLGLGVLGGLWRRGVRSWLGPCVSPGLGRLLAPPWSPSPSLGFGSCPSLVAFCLCGWAPVLSGVSWVGLPWCGVSLGLGRCLLLGSGACVCCLPPAPPVCSGWRPLAAGARWPLVRFFPRGGLACWLPGPGVLGSPPWRVHVCGPWGSAGCGFVFSRPCSFVLAPGSGPGPRTAPLTPKGQWTGELLHMCKKFETVH
jgi:hypothetical protein